MTKELLAVLGLGLTLIAAVFGFGMRIGTLTERVETQTKQIELLSNDMRAINESCIRWVGTHVDPPPPTRRSR